MIPQLSLQAQSWYANPDIRQALVEQAGPYRELAATYGTAFARNMLAYGVDDLRLILNGACSVFASVEKFANPLASERRIGWDFVIDLDGSDWNETQWVAAKLFRDVILPTYRIEHAKFKFSGRRGIHIIIPETAWLFYFGPEDFARAYPLVPSQLAKFFDALIYPESKKFCKIDHQVYSARRLLRCAYSIHHETGLVSVPIWPDDLERFKPETDADPKNVEVDSDWLKLQPSAGEASFLLDKAREWIQNSRTKATHSRPTRTKPSKPGRPMPCIEAFLREGFRGEMEGYRNLVLFNIIQAIKRFNLPISTQALIEANARSPSPLPEREVRATLQYHFEKRGETAYSFKSEIMQTVGLCPPEGCRLCRRPS